VKKKCKWKSKSPSIKCFFREFINWSFWDIQKRVLI